ALDAVVTGTVNGDVLNYTLATDATQFSGVGSHAIAVTPGSNPNYTVTPTDSSLTVSAKAATIAANAKSKSYGEVNPALDAVVTGTVNGDVLNYTLATDATQFSGVGSHAITVTPGSNPNYTVTPTASTLTINAAAATIVANSKSKSYGEVNPALDAVVTGAVNGDVISYTLATTATTSSGAGSYPIAVTLGSNPNYTVTPTDSSLTINAKTATIVANAKSKTYGEANPALDAVVTGTINGDVLNYTLGTTATAASGAGSYPISVTLGSNPNYTVTPTDASLTVNAKTATIVANAKSKTYGEANPALDAVVTGTINGDVLNYTLATTATAASGAGSYQISVTPGSNPNYTVTPTSSTLTVHAAAVTIAANPKTKIYGEVNPALDAVVTGAVNGDVLNYTLATDATQFSPVGSHPITVTPGSNPNYTVTPTASTLTVNAAAVTVVANDKSKTYGDANPGLDAVVTGTINGDVIDYTLETTATATSGAGFYPITVTLGTNLNYTVTSTNGVLTVGAKAATIVANAKSRTYGQVNPALDAVVSGAVDGDVLNYSLATDATQFSPVGSHAITVTLGSNPNYTITPTDSTLTVNAAAATIAANPKTRSYGQVNPALDAVVTGTLNGDVLNYTVATEATQFSAVGSHPITVTPGSNPNYTVTPTSSTLTVNAAAATIAANPKGRSYGEVNPALDAIVTGTVNGDVLNYTLATDATQFSPVGSHPITVTLGSNPNYAVTPNAGTLTVNPAAATIAANAKSKTYGESNPALDAVVAGTVNGDVLNFTLATTATTASGAGSYPITVTPGSNPNYTVTPTDGTLTVGAKAATIAANAKSRTYGEANPAFDAVVTGTIDGDVLNYTLATTATAASGAGSYPITVTAGLNPNYTVTPTASTLTVNA
ncbi:MAG: MBG domain-containing protein, partial [Verrucomicrobiota bacterium]